MDVKSETSERLGSEGLLYFRVCLSVHLVCVSFYLPTRLTVRFSRSSRFVQVRAGSCKFEQVRASLSKFVQARAGSCKFEQDRKSPITRQGVFRNGCENTCCHAQMFWNLFFYFHYVYSSILSDHIYGGSRDYLQNQGVNYFEEFWKKRLPGRQRKPLRGKRWQRTYSHAITMEYKILKD